MIDEVKTERVTGDVDGTIAGSSLLVFSVDPQWGNIYFWLGRERKNTKWPQGSETWSDFGGRPANEHEDAPTIAARQLWEETGGMLRYLEHLFHSDTAKTIVSLKQLCNQLEAAAEAAEPFAHPPALCARLCGGSAKVEQAGKAAGLKRNPPL